jgi:DNA-binding NarL/FixJ family response regulator
MTVASIAASVVIPPGGVYRWREMPEAHWATPALPSSRRDDHMNDAGGETIVCIRVLIADDQPRARRSLKALLTALRWSTPGVTGQLTHAAFFPVEIVGEAEDGQQAVAQVWALQPDVVVMDLHPHAASAPEPKPDGWSAIEMIKSRWPAIRIVVLTMYATDRTPALAAGADAFLLKGCPTSELLDAVMLGWL